MKREPLVSVVMPVYNGAKHLREAIDSVLSQSFTHLELIVVNDGSTDDSDAILNRYAQSDTRVRVFYQENKGVATALNRGIVEARGEYIARMDADDICLPDRITRQVAFMESNPEIGVCGTGWSFMETRCGGVTPPTDDREIRANQIFWPCIAHPTVMMRRELIEKYDLYYDIEFKQAEDYELWIRFARRSRMANIPEPLLLYRVCDNQATTKHEAEVHRWSSLVHKQAVALLGVEPTEEEIELHRALAGSTIVRTPDCIERAEAWLLKLADANEAARVYDQDALRRVLFKCWHSFCSRAAELGLWTWPAFRKSRLTEGFKIPARYVGSFAVRYALRSHTRPVYYRLSRFDAVWKTVATLMPRGASQET